MHYYIAFLIAVISPILYFILNYADVRILNFIKRIWFLIFSTAVFMLLYNVIANSHYNAFLPDAIINPTGYKGEVIGGLLTTFMVFLFFVLFSPIMEVSPKIFKFPSGHKFEGQYCIKAYNVGLFPLHEVRAYLTKVQRTKAEKGKFNVALNTIDITFSYVELLPSWTSRSARESGNMYANIYRVLPTENNEKHANITEVLNDDQDHSFYRFTISYRSSIGGLRRVKTENYTLEGVTEGIFCSGATFKKRK